MAITTEQVDAAITQILEGGQSVVIGGDTYTRADLSALWKLRKEIKSLEDSEAGGYAPRTNASQGGRG